MVWHALQGAVGGATTLHWFMPNIFGTENSILPLIVFRNHKIKGWHWVTASRQLACAGVILDSDSAACFKATFRVFSGCCLNSLFSCKGGSSWKNEENVFLFLSCNNHLVLIIQCSGISLIVTGFHLRTFSMAVHLRPSKIRHDYCPITISLKKEQRNTVQIPNQCCSLHTVSMGYHWRQHSHQFSELQLYALFIQNSSLVA